MSSYETYLFIEIIESIQGIQFIRQEEMEGVRARLYEGLQGSLVIIDISEEDIPEITGKAHLKKLGLEHLIPAMFPDKKEKQENPVEVREQNN